jgi:hypothetical protein
MGRGYGKSPEKGPLLLNLGHIPSGVGIISYDDDE